MVYTKHSVTVILLFSSSSLVLLRVSACCRLVLQVAPSGKPSYTMKSTQKAQHRLDAADCSAYWSSWFRLGCCESPGCNQAGTISLISYQEKITLSAVLTVARWIFMDCWRCRCISRQLLFAEYQLLHFHASARPRRLWRRRPHQPPVCRSSWGGFCIFLFFLVWALFWKTKMQPSLVTASKLWKTGGKKHAVRSYSLFFIIKQASSSVR